MNGFKDDWYYNTKENQEFKKKLKAAENALNSLSENVCREFDKLTRGENEL